MKPDRNNAFRAAVGALLLCVAATAWPQPLRPWAGGETPALQLPDVDGKVHRLADYRGKVVLINFWATWCAPCRKEMPSIERLRHAMEGKPFVILAVNVGEEAGVAREFGRGMQLGFPLLLDRDMTASRAWGARVLPATYVIGPDGVARYSHFGELDWAGREARSAIEALLPKTRLRSAEAQR
jgi:peroxiredoxin